ncbi:MAG TPA: hypothetical protein VHT27_04640 [Solirubrobacteraceae bacterium]|jgi:hypothetical protein|nr:hypothetical protein [Solirubrobacteraceae bacterium]
MSHPSKRAQVVRLLLALALGLSAALLISCGSSGKGLIPTAQAGPLQADFEAVSEAAQTGDGDCTTTETAIAKTEQDFDALPTSIDAGLRTTLGKGISNLRKRALVLCTQPLSAVSTGTTQTATTATTTTPTTPTTTPTTTTPTTATTPTTPTTATPPETGGGTEVPSEEQGESHAGGVGPGGTGPPGQEKKAGE